MGCCGSRHNYRNNKEADKESGGNGHGTNSFDIMVILVIIIVAGAAMYYFR